MSAPRLALAALVTAGCTDLSLDVTLDVPDEYEEEVDSVTLDVIAPGDALFECRNLELGDVGEATLEALRVDHALVGPEGSDALDGVPRAGHKLFYAQAYNEFGQLLVAGCAAHDVVEGEVEIVVEGQPAIYVSARETTPRSDELESLGVGLSDARGRPLAGVTARYRVVAANGGTPEREAVSDETGSLDVELDAPPWDGPQAVDLDVPWQANQPEPVTGFRKPDPKFLIEVPPATQAQDLRPEQIYQVGRIGPDGEMGVAVLGPPSDAGLRRVYLFIHQGGALVAVTSERGVRAGALGLVGGAGRDRLVVLNQDAWHEFGPDGSVASHVGSIGLAGDARRIVALPSDCGEPALRDRMLVDDGAGLFLFTDDLAIEDSRLTVGTNLLAAGCLLGTGGVYRSVVYQGGKGAVRLMAEIEGARPAVWPTTTFERGVSFTPPLGAGPYVLGNRFEVDGESIARYSLVRGPGEQLAMDVTLEDEVAGLSLATAGGDFDGDGALDVAGLVQRIKRDQSSEVRIFVALDATLEDVRLSGVSAPLASDDTNTQRYLDNQLYAADLDGDGFDELILAGRDRGEVYDLTP